MAEALALYIANTNAIYLTVPEDDEIFQGCIKEMTENPDKYPYSVFEKDGRIFIETCHLIAIVMEYIASGKMNQERGLWTIDSILRAHTEMRLKSLEKIEIKKIATEDLLDE